MKEQKNVNKLRSEHRAGDLEKVANKKSEKDLKIEKIFRDVLNRNYEGLKRLKD